MVQMFAIVFNEMKVILVLNVSQIVFHTKALIQILHDTFHYGHIVLNLTQTYFYS